MTDNRDVKQYLAKNHPLKRLGEPDEIADAAVFLASSLSNGVTGLNMSVDGGLHSKLGL
jgi:enoyl-[acyl-carrier-protein] reductase (NADH)